jgi:hypothetical protein
MEKDELPESVRDNSEDIPRVYSIVELKGIASSTRREFLTSTMKLIGVGGALLLTSQLLGCEPTTPTTTPPEEKPVAVILEISPNPANVGDSVLFRGGCADSSEEIDTYDWSIEDYGPIGYQATFATSEVTQNPGVYTVTLQVRNKDHVWSEPVTALLTVLPVETACTCDTVCTCVGHCTCDTVCTCQSQGRGTICTCDMVHYWYPN